LGYLSEPAATNLIRQSQALGTTWVTQDNVAGTFTTTNNSADLVAPDGTSTASKLEIPAVAAGANYAIVGQTVAMTAATYTFSVWLRTASGTSAVNLQGYISATGGSSINSNVTVTSTWQRFSVTGPTTAVNWNWAIGADATTTPALTAISAQTNYERGPQEELCRFMRGAPR
jgi:hypothetical protein